MTTRRYFLLWGAVLLFSASPVASSGDRLIRILQRQSIPERKQFACPCEFDLGRDIDGELGLVIDHNGDGQPAYANIDGEVLRFGSSRPFRFRCEKGEEIAGEWAASGVKLNVVLVSDGPGEESCWFRGRMSAMKGAREETREIAGACGC